MDALLAAAVVVIVHALVARQAGRSSQPRRQALAWIIAMPSTWLHEAGHTLASIALTGRGRIRLHAATHGRSAQDNPGAASGLVCLGSSDTLFYGPRSDAIVSAAPALLWWPVAIAVLASGPTAWGGALAGLMLWSGLLSRTDRQHLRRALQASRAGER